MRSCSLHILRQRLQVWNAVLLQTAVVPAAVVWCLRIAARLPEWTVCPRACRLAVLDFGPERSVSCCGEAAILPALLSHSSTRIPLLENTHEMPLWRPSLPRFEAMAPAERDRDSLGGLFVGTSKHADMRPTALPTHLRSRSCEGTTR